MPQTSADTVTKVITLVHGTFAKGADWTQDGSQLRLSLEERFGKESLHFEVFEWSGKNSDSARLDGASALCERLTGIVQRYPDAQQFIIGHSHGGNVILRALDGYESVERIAGAVSLATPFIQCECRDPSRIVGKIRSVSLVLMTLLAGWVIYYAGVAWHGRIFGIPAFVLVIPVWLVTAVFVWGKVCSTRGPALRLVTNRQAAYMARFDHPGQISTPFFCAATRFDEAGIGLRMGTMLAESPALLDRILAWFPLFLWVIIVGSGTWWWLADFELERGFYFLLPLLLGFSVAAQMALALVRTVLSGFRLGIVEFARRLFFGSGGMLMNSCVKFTTTKTPEGTLIPPELQMYDVDVEFRGLRHSAIYTTESVLKDVGEWIENLSLGR